MSIFDRAINEMREGMSGRNAGVPFGKKYDRLVSIIPNIQKKTYYLIGGGPKMGKSAFTNDAFLFSPYDELMLENPQQLVVNWLLFSFEIDALSIIHKGIARRLYLEHGIITDTKYLLSRGKNRLSTEIYELGVQCRDYFESLEDRLTIFEVPENPTGIKIYLEEYFEARGTSHFKESYNGTRKYRHFDHYVPNNPQEYTIAIIDHIALTKGEKDAHTTKEAIDKLSQVLVGARNKYGLTPVVVQQLNFDAGSSDRFKQKRITPLISDFGDSKYTTRDANYIMALFSPWEYELLEYEGYNTGLMKDRIRRLEVLRSRESGGNKIIYLNFCGENGIFREMDLPENLQGFRGQARYQKYLNFEAL